MLLVLGPRPLGHMKRGCIVDFLSTPKWLRTLSLAVLTICSVGCGSSRSALSPIPHAVSQPPQSITSKTESARIVASLISPAQSNIERSEVSKILNNLPPRYLSRYAKRDYKSQGLIIVDGVTGKIHYNRPDLANSFRKAATGELHLPRTTNPYSARKGGLHRGAESYTPGGDPGTGPYRRLYSNQLPAIPATDSTNAGSYYEMDGLVSVNCAAGNFVHPNGIKEAGFSYVGGWSPTAQGGGSSLDAGLQYNYQIGPNSQDDYSPFINIAGIGYVAGAGSGAHLACQSGLASYQFALIPTFKSTCDPSTQIGDPNCPTYAFNLEFAPDPNNRFANNVGVMYISDDATQGGWGSVVRWDNQPDEYVESVSCGGCVFKRMTTIAQSDPANPPPADQENLQSGSSFTSSWSGTFISCWANQSCSDPYNYGVVPWDASITGGCTEYPYWTGSFIPGQDECTATPSSVTGVSASVQVTNFTFDGESTSISLTY